MSDEEVKTVLMAEYRLLCLCDAFKNAFDGLASSSGVTTIPSMSIFALTLDISCWEHQ